MKTKLFTLIVLCLVTFSLSAQNFGVRAGVNLANMASEVGGDTDDGDAITGIYVGAFAEIALLAGLYLQPELNYIQKGAEFDIPIIGKSKTTYSYLEVPIIG